MNIQSVLSNANTFAELSNLANLAEAKLSSWGREYILVQGYEGELKIYSLAARTLELLKQKKYEFDEQEREVGKVLAHRIDRLINVMHKQVSDANCIVQVLNIINALVGSIFDIITGAPNQGDLLYEWHELGHLPNLDFYFYTEKQLENIGLSKEAIKDKSELETKRGVNRWRFYKISF